MKKIDICMYNAYSQIISVSDATTENLRKHIGDSHNIVTIHNGINLNRFTHNPILDPNTVKLVMVAAFRPQKDQDTVVRAMKLLPENVKLILAGDGERRPVVTKLSEDLGLKDRVTFTGNSNIISEILMSCNIVVLSSHWEGFGLAAVEGLAAGRPIVASNVAGLSDIVGDAGLFFEKENEKELAAKVMELVENKELYADLSAKALARAKLFDIDITAKKYLELYEA